MRRRLLELCLRAYPRARHEHERDYLRDLALDLSEAYGFGRQAMSLLRGGVRERIERRRGSRGASPSRWVKRVAVTSFVLGATALAVGGLSGRAAGERVRVEADRFECVRTEDLRGLGGCAGANASVSARVRSGWECEMGRRTEDGRRTILWRCALGQPIGGSAL